MKVIFLDFDGVLNNEIMYHSGYDNKFKNEPYPICAFDSNCIDRINKILKETGAKIVLSTSWRLDEIEKLQNLCSQIGLPIDFDRTPSFLIREGDFYRGDEIKSYLDNHPEIENYVILDDDDDMLPEQKKHFVRCKSYYGLTNKDTDKTIEILNSK